MALALGGCGGEQENSSNASAAANKEALPAGPMLGTFDLSKPIEAGGTRPYWQMRIAPGRITLIEKPAAHPTDLYPVTPKVDGDKAVFSTQTPEGVPVTVTLALARCGTPERTLEAELRIGERLRSGCAGIAAAAAQKAAP